MKYATIPDAIYAALVADTEFMANIGAKGMSPAIGIGQTISSQIKPSDGVFCLIEDSPRSNNNDTLSLWRPVYYLRFYGLKNSLIEQAATRARKLLDRWTAETDNGRVIGSAASGAFNAPTDDPNLVGRFVTISLFFEEN